MGADFAPYLAYVVPLALQSCNQDDGTFEQDSDEEDGPDGPASQDIGSDSEGGSEEGGRNISVRTGVHQLGRGRGTVGGLFHVVCC